MQGHVRKHDRELALFLTLWAKAAILKSSDFEWSGPFHFDLQQGSLVQLTRSKSRWNNKRDDPFN